MQDQTTSDDSPYDVKFEVTDEVRLVLMYDAFYGSNKIVLRKYIKTIEHIGHGIVRTLWRSTTYANRKPWTQDFAIEDVYYDSVDEFELDAAIKNLHSIADSQLWTLKVRRYTHSHILSDCEFQSKFYSWQWEQAIEKLNDSTATAI